MHSRDETTDMDPRILKIRTKASYLPVYTWRNEDDPCRLMPLAEFKDFVTVLKDTPKNNLIHDHQLNVVKNRFITLIPSRKRKLYTTQTTVCIDVLDHYLETGPNGKPFDPVPWMDDPLPVVRKYRGGWHIIDGHHRILVGHLLNRVIYCAVAVPKPEYAIAG